MEAQGNLFSCIRKMAQAGVQTSDLDVSVYRPREDSVDPFTLPKSSVDMSHPHRVKGKEDYGHTLAASMAQRIRTRDEEDATATPNHFLG